MVKRALLSCVVQSSISSFILTVAGAVREELPEEVGGFPVVFLRQVVCSGICLGNCCTCAMLIGSCSMWCS